MLRAFIKSYIINMAVALVWTALEHVQYKRIEPNRICDNVVFVLYMAVLWYAFSKNEKNQRNTGGCCI